ncbi:restriction endonuclease subunit S [uncultured Clostridium sp.]|uniref:restriction endonuclease subunit S n=1 Tax=uncultured Clostridium sp. TaxID=59620 RepID=UPI0025D414E4|nr:restriction endonuclease subunit S [uncultured Clostridium sp.]
MMNSETIKNANDISVKIVSDNYKRVGKYIIPNEWNIKKLKDLIGDLQGGVSVNSDDGRVSENDFAVLKVGCVLDGMFKPEECKKIKKEEIDRARINPLKDRIIISRANTPELVGSVGLVEKDYKNLFLSDKLWQATYSTKLDSRWLANILSTKKIKNRITLLATGTSRSMQNISKESFLSIDIPVPTYEEQKKITEIILSVDKIIELKGKLLKEKQRQKKGLMERLLTGKVRLNGSNEEVKMTKLKGYISEIKDKNKDNREKKVLSVTNKQGFILQEEQFDRIVASSDLSNYKIVTKGQFAYNPSRINVGSIDLLTRFESGLLSPMYVIFECENRLNSDYLYQFLKSDLFLNYIPRLLQGSVRDSLSFEALQQVKLFIPSLEEQKKISNLLKVSDVEIELLQKEIELLKEQKKGIIQLLLTGIVRVKCD